VPHYAARNVSSHLQACLKKLHWQLRPFRRLTHGKNILLLCCGDACRKKSLIPTLLPETRITKSPLTTIHVNACSLLRHFEDSLPCVY
jgi:hypothetical protein